jgi:hypothetical protein
MTSPKERFLTSGHAANFAKLVTSEAFEPACDYALSQLCSELPVNCQPGMQPDALLGFDANAQREGATRVLEILKTLAEVPKPPTQPTTGKLHY